MFADQHQKQLGASTVDQVARGRGFAFCRSRTVETPRPAREAQVSLAIWIF
jgi:hypothetical protein